MSYLYNFGLSQEDERTEAAALGLPGGRVLSIASAGDMPLSLLAMGAEELVAVDIDSNQLHLLHLKLAAVRRLEREDAIAFLGYLPAPTATRRRWLRDVEAALPPETRAFWRQHAAMACGGAIWAGRYERYLRRVQALLRPMFTGAVEALVNSSSIDEQRAVFTARLDRPALRGLFRVLFHPALFSRRGMDPRSLRHRDRSQSLGARYFERFRALCVETPARENFLLQLHALGRVVSFDTVPAYLSTAGVAVIRSRADRLRAWQTDIVRYLREVPPGSVDAAHLSNVPDWLSETDFAELLRAVARAASPGARLVWRYLHADRPVPSELRNVIRTDPILGERLLGGDRFPFYRIVPAEVRPQVAGTRA